MDLRNKTAYTLQSILASNTPAPPPMNMNEVARAKPRDLFGSHPWLRSKKRADIVSFLEGGQSCLVVKGPPGSLKTASIRWAAEKAHFQADELVIDGLWQEDRMRKEIEKSIGKAWFCNATTDNRVIIVYNADMPNIPDRSLTELLDRARLQKTNKFILEMNEVSPKMHQRLQSSGVMSIQFSPLTDKDLEAMMQFLIAEKPEERQPGLPPIFLNGKPDFTLSNDLIRRSQGDATRLDQNLRFRSDSKDLDSHPMVDTSKILRLSSVINDNWFEDHASNGLTNWVEGNLAENVGFNANCDCQSLDSIATFYEDMATFDMIILNDSLSLGGSTNFTIQGDELVVRSAHNTMKKVGLIPSPKLHGYAPKKADKQVQLSFRLSRGISSSKSLPSLEDCQRLRQSYSIDPALPPNSMIDTLPVPRKIDTLPPNGMMMPEAKRRKVTHSIPFPDTGGESQSPSDVMIFEDASLQDACDILFPYSVRPREVVQCRGFNSALVLQAPRPHRHSQGHESIIPLGERVSCQSHYRELLNKFDEKDDRVDKMKKLTLLTFKVAATNVLNIWSGVAKAIEFRDTDGINAYCIDDDTYMVLIYKRDQRKTPGVHKLPGFLKRYVGSKKHAANDIKITELVMSVLHTCQNMDSVCTLFCEELSKSSAFDLVAACRDMDYTELLYHRLAAQMVAEKQRDEFQRALCAGWGTIEQLIKASTVNTLKEKVWFATDERIAKLSSYKNFESFKWACFPVECKYFATDIEKIQSTDLNTILTNPKHPASYRKRSIVIMGKTRDGKSELAKSLARMMATMHQHHVVIEKRKFIFVTSAEDFKIEGLASHIEENVPLIFDDINPGKCMHHQADPLEFMKNMFTVKEARSLYMRNFNANLKAGPKIFTTNSNTITKFLELRPNQGEIGDDHVNAMLARCVLVEVKEKMYTHQQEDERDELEDDDWQTAKIEYDRCMGEGLL